MILYGPRQPQKLSYNVLQWLKYRSCKGLQRHLSSVVKPECLQHQRRYKERYQCRVQRGKHTIHKINNLKILFVYSM